MDTMMTFDNNNLCKFMTKDEMRAKAPYIFAKEPTNPKVSQKYFMATTETIVDQLATKGWGVVDCRQQRANKRSKIRSFHMVAFQNPNAYITKETKDGKEEIVCYPRIILTNSHDGFNSFKFMVGLFRLVCSNGLVIATDQFVDIKVKHINYTMESLEEVVENSLKIVAEQTDAMNDMESTILTDEQRGSLVVDALKIRKGIKADEPLKVEQNTIDEILTPTRTEDEGKDLWTTFNLIQEKMMNGNFSILSKKGKPRKARAIKGLAKDLSLNAELFKTALTYRAAA